MVPKTLGHVVLICLASPSLAQISVSRPITDESRIICHGTQLGHFGVSPAGGRIGGDVFASLAEFCGGHGVSCETERNTGQKRLRFDRLLGESFSPTGGLRNWEEIPFESPEWHAMVWLQRISEYCYNRCECLTQPGAPVRSLLRPFSTSVFVWDFAKGYATPRPPVLGEQTYLFWGDTSHSVKESVQAYRFVGNPAQRPRCRGQVDDKILRLWTGTAGNMGNTLSDATSLCLHRYYGGDMVKSMGGFCAPRQSQRGIDFVLDRTYRSTSLNDIIGSQQGRESYFDNHNRLLTLIERFCEERCACKSYDEYMSQVAVEKTVQPVERVGSKRVLERLSAQRVAAADAAEKRPAISSSQQGDTPSQACGGSCEKQLDCGNECNCVVEKESIDITASVQRTLFAACITIASSTRVQIYRLGGRDLANITLSDDVCPCNTTYVSAACCGRRDGIVWESARNKFGELKI